MYLTVLTEQGGVELWTSTGDSAAMAHSFNTTQLFSYVKWHSIVAEDGGMLLARYVGGVKTYYHLNFPASVCVGGGIR